MRLHGTRSIEPLDQLSKRRLRNGHVNEHALDSHIRVRDEHWVPWTRMFRLGGEWAQASVERLEPFIGDAFTKRPVAHVTHLDTTKDEHIRIPPESRDPLARFHHRDFPRPGR